MTVHNPIRGADTILSNYQWLLYRFSYLQDCGAERPVNSAARGVQQTSVTLNNLPISPWHDAAPAIERPAFSILMNLLTADGKIPVVHALDMLGEPDGSLLAAFEELPQAPFSSSSQLDEAEIATAARNGEIVLAVWRNNLRRIFLRRVGEVPPNQAPLELTIVGHCWMNKVTFQGALLRAELKTGEERRLRACLDTVLSEVATRNELPKLLDTLDDAVRHVESVCLYIEDEFFGVVERLTNLLGAGSKNDRSLFRDLISLPLDRWQPNHRLLVIALFLLFTSGRSVRFEEFSGKVLTARRLLMRLDTLARSYCIDAPSALYEPHTVLALAKRIGACALGTAPKGLLRYRYVNGVAFLKTEKAIQEANHDDSLAGISPRLCALYDRLGKGVGQPSSARSFFTLMARRALETPDSELSSWFAATPAKTPIEAVFQEIVASAVLATRADYGMSSSLRDPGVFLVEDGCEAMLRLTTKDFYNCMVSRPGLAESMSGTISQQIYKPVQSRMQFNRWHFIAGNFPRERIPQTRHYFFPPALPDIDEWTDQNHTGHINSQVRYSIRSPGPDMHDPPLVIGIHSFRGFYDVRVVRMNAPAFSLSDMLMVRRHCIWMGAVWGVIAAVVNGSGHDGGVRIGGFQLGEGFTIPA